MATKAERLAAFLKWVADVPLHKPTHGCMTQEGKVVFPKTTADQLLNANADGWMTAADLPLDASEESVSTAAAIEAAAQQASALGATFAALAPQILVVKAFNEDGTLDLDTLDTLLTEGEADET